MLYKSKIFNLETMVYSGCIFDECWIMGPSGRFYSYICLVMLLGSGYVPWVELPVQRRLCPIFMSGVE